MTYEGGGAAGIFYRITVTVDQEVGSICEGVEGIFVLVNIAEVVDFCTVGETGTAF